MTRNLEIKDLQNTASKGFEAAYSAALAFQPPVQSMLSNYMQPSIEIGTDFHGWLLDQAEALRQRRYLSLDWDNLAEELEAMAARDRREMRKHLKKLLLHLLKFKAKPEEMDRYHSWRTSVREAREDITDLLKDSPGLFQGNRQEFLATAYERARADAVDETGLHLEDFAETCMWSFDDIMQTDFYPGVTKKND